MTDKTKMPGQGEMAPRPNSYTMAQFRDGSLALLMSEPGQSTRWGEHTRTRQLRSPSSDDAVIVTTDAGRRFGIGKGVIIELPEIDKATGKFASPQPKSGALLNGQPEEVTIGETWGVVDIGIEDPVKSVLVKYDQTSPGSTSHEEIGAVSPFHELSEMLVNASEKLRAVAPASGGLAVRGATQP